MITTPAWIRWSIYLMLFIVVAFPKAGVKIGQFPVYLSMILSYAFALPLIFFQSAVNIRRTQHSLVLVFVLLTIAVSFINWLVLFPSGQNPVALINWSYIIAYMLSMISISFVLIFDSNPVPKRRFFQILLSALGIVILYAFVQKIFGEVRTVIPGLTFNYSEGIHLPAWWDKHNFSPLVQKIKLASTYQNGNVFAVNFIMVFWFAFHILLSKDGWLFRLATGLMLAIYGVILFFTYSGTGYAGLLLSLALFLVILVTRRLRSNDIRNKTRDMILLIGVPAMIIAAGTVLVLLLPQLNGIRDTAGKLLFQRNLLNNERIGLLRNYLEYLYENRGWFEFLFGSLFDPRRAGGAYEITLAAVFVNSGILFTGFFVYTVFRLLKNLKLEICNIGLFSYLAVSFIDGAYWLPPTAVVFWTLVSASLFLIKKENSTA